MKSITEVAGTALKDSARVADSIKKILGGATGLFATIGPILSVVAAFLPTVDKDDIIIE